MAKKIGFAKAMGLTKPDEDQSPSVVYEGLILWVDGVPTLRGAPARISSNPDDALRELMRIALDLPYDGKDKSLIGMTQGEAMIIQMSRDAANGDHDARTAIMDRIMGRPQQNIKAVHLHGDINELLDQVARETCTMVVDAEGVPRPPDNLNVEDL